MHETLHSQSFLPASNDRHLALSAQQKLKLADAYEANIHAKPSSFKCIFYDSILIAMIIFSYWVS